MLKKKKKKSWELKIFYRGYFVKLHKRNIPTSFACKMLLETFIILMLRSAHEIKNLMIIIVPTMSWWHFLGTVQKKWSVVVNSRISFLF